jgi:hypothetical protein
MEEVQLKIIRLLFALLLSSGVVACATSSPNPGTSGQIPAGVYQGFGKDQSPLKAMNEAKLDAVNKYVQELMGNRYDFYKQQIQTVVLSSDNPNQFVHAEQMQVVSQGLDSANGAWFYAIQIPVRRDYVKTFLTENSILPPGSTQAATPNATGSLPPSATDTPANPAVALTATADDFGGTATPEEQRFIRQYISTLTYMVYWDTTSKASPELLKAGAIQADRWLSTNGFDVVDLGQVEKIKAEDQKVFQEEVGGNGSYIQWVAQKLNAGVYIELSLQTATGVSSGMDYGQVNLLIKCYDPSTGELLGATPFNSPRTVSPSSKEDALTRAIEASVWQAMPVAVAQIKAQLAQNLLRGVKYDLIVQQTSDPRLMNQFRKKLSERVKLLKTISFSPQETRYQVFYLGTAGDLGDLIYKVSGDIPGLEGMNEVLMRGRALTFNTGLK